MEIGKTVILGVASTIFVKPLDLCTLCYCAYSGTDLEHQTTSYFEAKRSRATS